MQNNIKIVQLASYVRPEIREESGRKWVLNGVNNKFFNYVIDRYNGSPTNRAIIDSYNQMAFGFGLKDENIYQIISKKELKKVIKDYVLFGMAYFELTYKNGKVVKIFHTPVEKLAPSKANENGDIDSYWYSYDWENTQKFKPKEIPSYNFGSGSNKTEIFCIKEYEVGHFYFSNPSYLSGLPYAELEEEIANYCINHIKNGLSFGHVININSGKPESEEQLHEMSKGIINKLTGSTNAGKFLLSFNDNKEVATTVEPLTVSDAHQQYQFLSEEARNQICVSHKVVSGAILGINKSTGFSSDAEQIETAINETMLNVIQPIQEVILDALNDVLAVETEFINLRTPLNDEAQSGVENVETIDGIYDAKISYNGAQIASAIDIFAKVKQGILTTEQAIVFLVQFLNIDTEVAQSLFTSGKEAIQQLALISKSKKKIKMSKTCDHETEIDSIADALIDLGEDVDDNEWELIDESKVIEEPILTETAFKLAKTFTSFPNAKSEQDTDLFKIRYQYAPKSNSDNSREFCVKMVKADKVYRKEDIEFAGQKVVNKGFGPNGTDTYSIWLYKGGARCHHFWMRKIYLRRNNKSISVNEAKKMILDLEPSDRKENRLPENNFKVAQLPNDMPNNGFLPK